MGLEPPTMIIPLLLVALITLALTGFAWKRGWSPVSLLFGLLTTNLALWLIAVGAKQAALWLQEKGPGVEAIFLGAGWEGLWVHLLAVGIGAQLVLRRMARVPFSQRWPAVLILTGLGLPWAANFVFLTRHPFTAGQDLTPLGFSLMGLLYAWMLFRHNRVDLLPLAHEAVLENTDNGYLVLDTQDRVIEASSLACRLLGVEEKKIIGQPVIEALSSWPVLPDLLRQPTLPQAELASTGETPVVIEVRMAHWLQQNGRPAGRILFLRDITQQRRVEEDLRANTEALRESERLYKLLVNASPVGIVLIDENSLISYASPTLLDLYQMPDRQEFLGHSPVEWIHPEDRPIAIVRLLKAIEEQENLPSREYRLMRKDGSYFWGEVTSTPIIDDQGDSRGVLAMIREVTSRKTLELRLQQNLEQQMFINKLLQVLYRPPDLMNALAQVLEKAGLFTEASRVYLCQDSSDGEETSIVLEWCGLETLPRAHEGALVRYAVMPSWKKRMDERGIILVPDRAAAPNDIAEYMSAWNALSLAAFPIYGIDKHLFGFIGFDHCAWARDWKEEEIDLLWSVCRIVSGAVAQRQTEEAEHRQRVLAEALHDTASALNSTLNFEEVLDRILANLEQIATRTSASIAMVDEEGMVRFVRWRGYDGAGEQRMRTLSIPFSERETYVIMAQTGQPIIIQDTWADKRWNRDPEYAWIRSYAGAPIMIKGQVAGFINLDSGEPDTFTPDLLYSLHVFADQATVAIENARLYDAERQRAEEMTILNHIGLILTTGLETQQVLVSLLEQCRQVLPIDIFYVALHDANTGMIDLPLYYTEEQYVQAPPRNILENPGITAVVIRERKTIYLPDTFAPEVEQQYNLVRLGGRPARSYVGVPLTLMNQVVGVISMQNYQSHAYQPEQIRLLETIATQAAVAVQNARLYDQMKQMAITDSVTQLFTRRHFTVLGRTEVERAQRYQRSLSVLMVDIDHFKQVNDTYGHNAGDQVLLMVAQVCKKALRETDSVGRWGGEEFAVLLPDAETAGAAFIAERIRRMVAEASVPIPQGNAIQVTISIGVAGLSDTRSTLEVLIDCADQAMYQAKQAGRNRVKVLEEVTGAA